jgi:hypothetical protein
MNLRTVAALWKQDVLEMFSQWNEDKPLRTGFPHASNILAPDHSFCMRQLVLAAVYPDQCKRPPTKPWDTLVNARFKHGWVIHEKYQDLFKQYGDVVFFEDNPDTPELDHSHFDEERLIWFSPDAIMRVEGEKMPVEMKGYNQAAFDKMDENGTAPVDAHKQVNLYMHLLELKHGLILVENKNTQDIKVWCVEYDREMVQPYLDRIYHFRTALHKAENDLGLPNRICNSRSDRNAEKCLACSVCFSKKG